MKKMNIWESEIKAEFKDYLLRPFPELIRIEDPGLVKSYIKSNIIDKIIRLDISGKFKHLNQDTLLRLIDIFYSRPGTYINYDEISNDLKIGKKTLIDHIFYLEFAYLIRRVRNFRPGSRTTTRKMQRIYPFHWSLGFGWNGLINFETIIATSIDAKFYWRKNEKEIDFLDVKDGILPIEAKESMSISRGDMKHLVYFMKKFGVKKCALIYNGEEGLERYDSMEIRLIPLWKWMFLPTDDSIVVSV